MSDTFQNRKSKSEQISNEKLKAKMSLTILEVIIQSFNEGRLDFIQSIGVSAITAEKLSRLTMSQIFNLATDSFFELTVTDRALELLITRTLSYENKAELENVAIRLGATKRIMKQYANMTPDRYMQKLKLCDREEPRNKPKSLGHDQINELHALRAGFVVAQ